MGYFGFEDNQSKSSLHFQSTVDVEAVVKEFISLNSSEMNDFGTSCE